MVAIIGLKRLNDKSQSRKLDEWFSIFPKLDVEEEHSGGGKNGENSFFKRLEKIYLQQKMDFIYSVFLRVKKNVDEKYVMEPKGLPYEFYSLASIKYKHWLDPNFNPLRIDHLENALKILDNMGARIISNAELWRRYRMLGVPDSSILEKIKEKGVEWYVTQINSKLIDWATSENGFVGRYVYKKWDCYDFVTAVLFAVENDVERAIDVKNKGWKTTDSIYNYGYDWIHASFGPSPWKDIREGMILYAQRCSPISRTRDHWGIVARFPEGLRVVHRTGKHYPCIDSLEFFYRYSNRDNEKVVHVYFLKVD